PRAKIYAEKQVCKERDRFDRPLIGAGWYHRGKQPAGRIACRALARNEQAPAHRVPYRHIGETAIRVLECVEVRTGNGIFWYLVEQVERGEGVQRVCGIRFVEPVKTVAARSTPPL